MRKILRPYQQNAVDAILQKLKESTDPILVDASVGSGKSLICASVLLKMEQAGYKALCLTLNSTLIQQNANTYETEGGTCGIYVASINRKETDSLIIFGSPQSVCNGIKHNKDISHSRFNLIIIDECHNINHNDRNSMYMRIISHYGLLAQTHDYSYRIVGLSGTCYRGKAISILGPNEFFKNIACSISTSWLIQQGFLTKPVFGLTESQSYDFSNIRVNSMGKFLGRELQAVIEAGERLTGKITKELQEVMKNRTGAFIFCCTKAHCIEASKCLPPEETRIITSETSHEDRKEIIELAKALKVRYLINVNVLLVGVDIPIYDTCVFLRPTESLVLFTQAIGRVLRLHENKSEALVLDFAQNLQIHGHIDDPIINEALQPKKGEEHEFIIPCPCCSEKGNCTLNRVTARRCIGSVNGNRCDHYFTWKECPGCQKQNDITSRQCAHCHAELIDPNKKLTLNHENNEVFTVSMAKYWVLDKDGFPSFSAMYQCTNGLRIYESFWVKDERNKNIFYGVWVKKHVKKSSDYYMVLNSRAHLQKMLDNKAVMTPYEIECVYKDGRYKILKRKFYNEESVVA